MRSIEVDEEAFAFMQMANAMLHELHEGGRGVGEMGSGERKGEVKGGGEGEARGEREEM